jgi:hypothetical protein
MSFNPHCPVLYTPAERAVCILKRITTAHSSALHISLSQSRPSPGFITPVPQPSASGLVHGGASSCRTVKHVFLGALGLTRRPGPTLQGPDDANEQGGRGWGLAVKREEVFFPFSSGPEAGSEPGPAETYGPESRGGGGGSGTPSFVSSAPKTSDRDGSRRLPANARRSLNRQRPSPSSDSEHPGRAPRQSPEPRVRVFHPSLSSGRGCSGAPSPIPRAKKTSVLSGIGTDQPA